MYTFQLRSHGCFIGGLRLEHINLPIQCIFSCCRCTNSSHDNRFTVSSTTYERSIARVVSLLRSTYMATVSSTLLFRRPLEPRLPTTVTLINFAILFADADRVQSTQTVGVYTKPRRCRRPDVERRVRSVE